MTSSANSMVSDQLAGCIAGGREPTVHELFSQAECMWIDGAAGRSTFTWGQLASDAGERLIALRGAQLALLGDSDDRAVRRPAPVSVQVF